MTARRVVVTGMGAVSPYGQGVAAMLDGLREGRSAIRAVPELAAVKGLRTRVGGLVPGVDPRQIERHYRRSMTPMSIFSVLACREALAQGGLTPADIASGRLGVCIGSTVGSIQATEAFFRDYFIDHSLERMRSTTFFQIMNHSCATNAAQTLGITGRVVAPAAACSTSCQAVGLGREMIAQGRQEWMLCGGADEFHPLTAATFDVMSAASTRYNDTPELTPRPFDRDRDGVVCSEGAGILLIESLESALARGARILAEIAGFATISDPTSIANPSSDLIESCMRQALEDAGATPAQVGYVNAHATATLQGDAAEAQAIARIFGERVPVSSLKGHLGHTMAASGTLEMAAVIDMLAREALIPTRNLSIIDDDCAGILLSFDGRSIRIDWAIKNNFALGGVNSTIVMKRYACG